MVIHTKTGAENEIVIGCINMTIKRRVKDIFHQAVEIPSLNGSNIVKVSKRLRKLGKRS